MADNWPTRPLKDVVHLQRGHDLPARARRPGPVPVISSGGPSGWHDEPIADGPGVVLGRATNLGKPYWVDGPYWPLNTTLYVRDFLGNDPRYVFHLFQTLDLTGYNSGSVQPMLNRNYIANVPIALPPPDEQRRIAGVLGALDDLIDTNTRLADHLEGLLHTMFAKAGFDTPSDNGTVLADIIEVNPRLPKPATVAPYVDMAALPTARARVQSIAHRQPTGGARFQNGDTLLARITPCLENGKTAYIDSLRLDDIGIGSTEFIVLRSTGVLGSHWSYFLARSTRFRDYAIRHMSGTSGRQRCSSEAIERYPIAMPDADEVTLFAATAAEMFAAMKELDEEAVAAGRTRDELLPLLLSGQVRVDEVAG